MELPLPNNNIDNPNEESNKIPDEAQKGDKTLVQIEGLHGCVKIDVEHNNTPIDEENEEVEVNQLTKDGF